MQAKSRQSVFSSDHTGGFMGLRDTVNHADSTRHTKKDTALKRKAPFRPGGIGGLESTLARGRKLAKISKQKTTLAEALKGKHRSPPRGSFWGANPQLSRKRLEGIGMYDGDNNHKCHDGKSEASYESMDWSSGSPLRNSRPGAAVASPLTPNTPPAPPTGSPHRSTAGYTPGAGSASKRRPSSSGYVPGQYSQNNIKHGGYSPKKSMSSGSTEANTEMNKHSDHHNTSSGSGNHPKNNRPKSVNFADNKQYEQTKYDDDDGEGETKGEREDEESNSEEEPYTPPKMERFKSALDEDHEPKSSAEVSPHLKPANIRKKSMVAGSDKSRDELLNLLYDGTDVMKHGKKGKPKTKALKLNDDGTMFTYIEHSNQRLFGGFLKGATDGEILVENITEVRKGIQTEVMHNAKLVDPQMALSFIMADDRTVDVVFEFNKERDLWLRALKILFEDFNQSVKFMK